MMGRGEDQKLLPERIAVSLSPACANALNHDCKVTRQQCCRAISNVSRAFQVPRLKVECSWDERFVQGGQSESNEVFD
jgi:hypothetical protein